MYVQYLIKLPIMLTLFIYFVAKFRLQTLKSVTRRKYISSASEQSELRSCLLFALWRIVHNPNISIEIHNRFLFLNMEFIPSPRVPQKHNLEAKCAVCGDAATGHYYYGGLSCFSCRTFFRRCVFKTSLNSCLKSENCEVRLDTRSMCQYCRFQKCLKIGMDPEQVTPPLEGKRSSGNIPR